MQRAASAVVVARLLLLAAAMATIGHWHLHPPTRPVLWFVCLFRLCMYHRRVGRGALDLAPLSPLSQWPFPLLFSSR